MTLARNGRAGGDTVRSLARVGLLSVTVCALLACGASPPRPTVEPAPSSASAPHSSVAGVTDAVQTRMTRLRALVPGVIALVRVGQETSVLVAGNADVRAQRPLTAGATFPVASLTKTMVATAALELVQSGRLRLDDTVEEWLPGVVAGGDLMTVRMLLAHRSGIHRLSDRQDRRAAHLSPERYLRVAGSAPPDFVPGTDAAYSNEGYLALGLLVERAAGIPLDEVLARTVLGPARMTSTALAPGDWDVHGYADGRDVTAQARLPLAFSAGGMVSTVQDVDRFFRLLWAGDLVDDSTLDEMTGQPEELGGVWGRYGLGVWVLDTPCGTAVGHSGDMPGYAIRAWTLQAKDRSVVVVVNDADQWSVADELAEIALCAP